VGATCRKNTLLTPINEQSIARIAMPLGSSHCRPDTCTTLLPRLPSSYRSRPAATIFDAGAHRIGVQIFFERRKLFLGRNIAAGCRGSLWAVLDRSFHAIKGDLLQKQSSDVKKVVKKCYPCYTSRCP